MALITHTNNFFLWFLAGGPRHLKSQVSKATKRVISWGEEGENYVSQSTMWPLFTELAL